MIPLHAALWSTWCGGWRRSWGAGAGAAPAALVRPTRTLLPRLIHATNIQDLYVAVTKATLGEEVVPKEKHVRSEFAALPVRGCCLLREERSECCNEARIISTATPQLLHGAQPPSPPPTPALKIACSAHAPRPQVDFVIYKLSKRLNNPSWVISLKALMVFHRLMRECDPSFQEQVGGCAGRAGGGGVAVPLYVCALMPRAHAVSCRTPALIINQPTTPTPPLLSSSNQLVRFCDRTGRHRMLCLDRYADHTSKETWDYSACIRAYGVYLDERLDAFRWGLGGCGGWGWGRRGMA